MFTRIVTDGIAWRSLMVALMLSPWSFLVMLFQPAIPLAAVLVTRRSPIRVQSFAMIMWIPKFACSVALVMRRPMMRAQLTLRLILAASPALNLLMRMSLIPFVRIPLGIVTRCIASTALTPPLISLMVMFPAQSSYQIASILKALLHSVRAAVATCPMFIMLALVLIILPAFPMSVTLWVMSMPPFLRLPSSSLQPAARTLVRQVVPLTLVALGVPFRALILTLMMVNQSYIAVRVTRMMLLLQLLVPLPLVLVIAIAKIGRVIIASANCINTTSVKYRFRI